MADSRFVQVLLSNCRWENVGVSRLQIRKMKTDFSNLESAAAPSFSSEPAIASKDGINMSFQYSNAMDQFFGQFLTLREFSF